MPHKMQTATPFLAAALLACIPLSSWAVDGVILIDQNRVLAGSVTPGDMPGFPLVIGQPGSYRLAGNLTVPQQTIGILISSPGVTLDLNGFSITVSGQVGTGISDNGVNQPRTVIRNGQVIAGQFGAAIKLGASSGVIIEDMVTSALTGTAIVVGAHSRVVRNLEASNGLIQMICPSIVMGNITPGAITRDVTNGPCVFVNNSSQF